MSQKNQLQTHFETVSSCKCFKRQLHEFSKVNLCRYFTCLSCFYLRCESWPHCSAFWLSLWCAAPDHYIQIQASAKDVKTVRLWLPVTSMAPKPHLKLAQDTWRSSFISIIHHSTTSVGLVANSGQKEKRTGAPWQYSHLWSKCQADSSAQTDAQFGVIFYSMLLKVTDLFVTEPYGTEPWIPGTALHHPLRRAFAPLQVEMSFLSPTTASSLNNQAEESASIAVFERWWFTAGGRQEMLPVQHCRLVAGWGERENWDAKGKNKMIFLYVEKNSSPLPKSAITV